MPLLILVRGVPGSGKTTIARKFAAIGFEHVEADQFFERGGKYEFDAAQLPDAHANCLQRAKMAIREGRDCVVANTFTRYWEMAPYIELAAQEKARFVAIVAPGNFESVHGVPADKVQAMRERFEV